MKLCRNCNKIKPYIKFYFSGGRYRHPCKDCNKSKRFTMEGVLKQRWLGILGRISGKGGHYTSAVGKKSCSKEEFLLWAKKNKKLRILYKDWVKNNFDRNLSPSIDRIDISKGYTLDNIQWLTMWENNSKGHKDHSYTYGRKKVRLTKGNKEIFFNSSKEASFYFGKNRQAATNNIRMGHKLQGWTCEYV